ncbi:MAG: helix-turn-helix domain-containing protein [Pseudomonadota bacterium]
MGIPVFELYGEADAPGSLPDTLHCESIAARSRLHDWTFTAHRHDALHQFFWITKGGGRASIDGVPHGFGQATLIFVPRLTVHGFSFTPGTAGWVVTVPASLALPLPEAPQILKVAGASEPTIVTGIFSTIAEEHDGSRPARRDMLAAQAAILSVWVLRTATMRDVPRESSRRRLMRRFTALIEEHYRAQWQVDAYAEALAVTPTHLTRVCRDVTGKAASTLIQDRVMLEARRLLVYTRLRIGQIAHQLGYSDPAYFTRVFTARAKMTPTAFRATADRPADAVAPMPGFGAAGGRYGDAASDATIRRAAHRAAGRATGDTTGDSVERPARRLLGVTPLRR